MLALLLTLTLNALKARRRDEGASAVEYALLVGAIAAIIIAAVFVFQTFVADIFTQTEAELCVEEPTLPGC